MSLTLQPIDFDEACAFIRTYHRHHHPPVRDKFRVAVNDGHQIVGVAMVGRPVARGFQDGWTVEVLRLCTLDVPSAKNAASMLYRACWRAAKNLGFKRIITYTLQTENGISLSAAAWKILHEVKGRSWSCESRPRIDIHPTQDKFCWSPCEIVERFRGVKE